MHSSTSPESLFALFSQTTLTFIFTNMERRIILLLLLFLPCLSLAQWKKAGTLPSGYVRNLFMTTNGEVYAVGEKSLFWSGDRGESWTKITLPKPFTINCFHQYGTSIFFGTENYGIYQYEKGKNPEWKSITDKLNQDKLADESLSVGSIISSDDIILADVYHLGHPDFGGSHTRIYISRNRGETWQQQQLENVHYKVYSFAFTKGSEVHVASSQGILRADVNKPTFNFQTLDPDIIAKKIVQAGNILIGIPDYDYFAALSQNYYNKLFVYDLTDEKPQWSTITLTDSKAALGVTDISYTKGDLFISTYFGVCKTTMTKLTQSWELILGGSGNSAFYTANIKVSDQGNKYVTPELGIKRQLAGNNNWNDANNNLEISYIYDTHLTSKYLLAVTENGLFRTATTGDKFDWKQVDTKLTPSDRFIETTRAFIVTTENGEIIVGTNNGFIKSANQGETWTVLSSLPVETITVRGSQVQSKVFFQSYLQDVASAGGNLFALALERIYLSKDGGKTWQYITDKLPDKDISIKGLQVLNNEAHILYEKYPNTSNGHDVWTVPDASIVYKYTSQNLWAPVLTINKRAHIYGFVAHNGGLFFSAKDATGTYTFHSVNFSGAPSLQTITNPLTIDDGYIQRFYSSGNSLFLTTLNSKAIYVSTNGGQSWKKAVEDPPSTPSTFTISNTHIYAGINGSGIWYRPFSDFFPVSVNFLANQKPVEAEADKDARITMAPEGKLLISPNISGTVVNLYTRSLTRDKWITTPLTSTSDTFAIKLPVNQFDSVGLEYFVSVLPPAEYRNPAKPTIYTDTIQVALRFSDGLRMNTDLKFGRTKNDYNFISLPVDLNDQEAKKVLSEVLGGNTSPNNTVWRLLTYAGLGSPAAEEGDPRVWQPAQQLEPGVGYWLAIANEGAVKRIQTGNGQSVVNYRDAGNKRTFSRDYFTIKLAPGFNQVGNPFYLRISWDEVLSATNNAAVGQLVTYNQRNGTLERMDRNTVLEPFSGGFVYNSSSDTVLLKIPVKRNSTLNGARRKLQTKESEMPFLVDFTVRTHTTLDAIAGIGVHGEAQTGLDALDKISPPSIGDFPQVQFLTSTKDAVSRSVLPVARDGQTWDFEIKEAAKGQEISFDWAIQQQEDAKDVWLHDLTTETKVNMNATTSYSFSGSHRFRIYYGILSFIEQNLVPETSIVNSGYPNPFQRLLTVPVSLPKGTSSYQVQMRLLNNLGQRLSNWQSYQYPPGFHQLEFHTQPYEIPTGTYILEVEIADSHQSRKYYQKLIKK